MLHTRYRKNSVNIAKPEWLLTENPIATMSEKISKSMLTKKYFPTVFTEKLMSVRMCFKLNAFTYNTNEG